VILNGGNDTFTKILLHMDGSNGGTTFTDSNIGGSAHTWAAQVGSPVTSTAAKEFGTASLDCGAAANSISTADSADFTLGSGDFTVDFWFNRQGGDGTRRFLYLHGDGATATSSIECELSAANVIVAYLCSGSTLTTMTGTTTFTSTGWHHFALTRSGNNVRVFLDGVQEGSTLSYSSTINDPSNNFVIGSTLSSLMWNGFLDEFRLSVGIARWTANFTPPVIAYARDSFVSGLAFL